MIRRDIRNYIKQVIAEAISTDAAYKAHIKSLFEQFPLKFSASYMQYREYNYPSAWIVKSLSHAEDFGHQHIKLLFEERDYIDYALIYEHEGSIYVMNDKAFLPTLALALDRDAVADTIAHPLAYWNKYNYLFKLSVSDFEIAMDVADTYEEFITLCSSMNVKHE